MRLCNEKKLNLVYQFLLIETFIYPTVMEKSIKCSIKNVFCEPCIAKLMTFQNHVNMSTTMSTKATLRSWSRGDRGGDKVSQEFGSRLCYISTAIETCRSPRQSKAYQRAAFGGGLETYSVWGQLGKVMEVDRLSEGLTRINMDMEADAKHGVYWPGCVALGAATFAIFNFLTRWLLPGERRGDVRCPNCSNAQVLFNYYLNFNVTYYKRSITAYLFLWLSPTFSSLWKSPICPPRAL